MGNFAVSLKRLVEKVSLEVIYTPAIWTRSASRSQRSTVPPVLAGYYDYSISCVFRSWALRR